MKQLQGLATNHSQWGSWSEKLHKKWQQKERQYRAYEILDKDQEVDSFKRTGIINCYQTSLYECSCPDFEKRKLACKHIYCLAILLGEKLLISPDNFKEWQEEVQRGTIF